MNRTLKILSKMLDTSLLSQLAHQRHLDVMLIASIVLIASACTPSQTTKPAPEPVARDAAALAALEAGDNAGAAQQYALLAQSASEPEATRFRLAEVDAWLRAGDTAQAKAILEGVPSNPQDAGNKRWRSILEANLDAIAGAHLAAMTRLEPFRKQALPPAQLHGFYRARALALESAGQPLEAARTRVALENLLRGEEAINTNRSRLWSDLQQLNEEQLRQAKGSSPDVFNGWLELASIASTTLHKPAAFRESVAAWRLRFPSHPAQFGIIERLYASSEDLALQPKQIALLLPLSGKFAKAGKAVQDGVIAAWFEDPRGAEKPAVRVYDANPANVLERYSQAVADGADLIIGPLEKPAVEALAQHAEYTRTILALNTIDPALINPEGGKPFYQFGLSPEREAQQVAQMAAANGHERALIISPDTPWGQRVHSAFTEQWEQSGGIALEHVQYDPGTQNFADPTKALLNIDGSEQRHKALRAVLQRDIKFEARRRQDAEFVFLAGFPVHARQIRPQLEFFRAENLPVYSTSHVYTGTINREQDRDMNGVIFADMPWLIAPDQRSTSLYNAVIRNWATNARSFPRLYALGIDAYNVVRDLGRLKIRTGTRVAGQTGTLSIDPSGKLTRQLTWARFVDGQPVPVSSQLITPGTQ